MAWRPRSCAPWANLRSYWDGNYYVGSSSALTRQRKTLIIQILRVVSVYPKNRNFIGTFGLLDGNYF